jgi:predicted AAA+ superfamily ATPase
VLLEDLDKKEVADTDPRKFLADYPDGAIFDEIQECPQLLSYMLGIVDNKKKNGMFILTGSQNILMLDKVKQSLAGRMAILDLWPLSLSELASKLNGLGLNEIIYRGGYPKIWNEKVNPSLQMSQYVKTYVERDVREIVNVRNLSLFRKFLILCAGRAGSIMNKSSLCNDLGISDMTVQEWLSVLEASNLIFFLPPFYENFNKRILKTPKLYFVDTALVCYLLGINKPDQVYSHPLYGNLFENLIISEFKKQNFLGPAHMNDLYFFRDKSGHEVDLIKETKRENHIIEIKAGQTFNYDWLKGLTYLEGIAKDKIKSKSIIYAGKEVFETKDVHVYSYQALGALFNRI